MGDSNISPSASGTQPPRASSLQLPSIVLFSPLGLPTALDMRTLRTTLHSDIRISPLLSTLRDLPAFWARLVQFDPDLAPLGSSWIDTLLELVHAEAKGVSHDRDTDTELPDDETHQGPYSWSAAVLFPLNFLVQIGQYMRLLSSMSKSSDDQDPHTVLLTHLKGGTHGFCVGFLAAVTVASSRSFTTKDLVENAARVLRLAVCIGAYVALDAEREGPWECISVTRKEKRVDPGNLDAQETIGRFPDAYISARTDIASLTITLRPEHRAQLTEALLERNFQVSPVPAVRGRFHSRVHAAAAERLVGFFDAVDLCLPGLEEPRVPVRSAVCGQMVEGNRSLVSAVLENTLVKSVDWYETVREGVGGDLQPEKVEVVVGRRHVKVAIAGLGSWHTGHSVLADLGLRADHLRDINLSSPSSSSRPDPRVSESHPTHTIAITGMAGLFPGSSSISSLWSLLLSGQSMVSDDPPPRIGLDQLQDTKASDWTWHGNFLSSPSASSFDHKLFGKSAREAAIMDPQQRKLLEVVYEALESAGHFSCPSSRPSGTDEDEKKNVGIFTGCVSNAYTSNLLTAPASAYAVPGTGRGFLSGLVSHFFGLTGPALTIDTACSSSLAAVHVAIQSLLTDECHSAIAAGVNIFTGPGDYRDLRAGGFLSPSGQCRPFDEAADGYCRGEGVGAVVLKRYADAVRDGDPVLAVILGSKLAQQGNSDGKPVYVPRKEAQTRALRDVLDRAGVRPRDVGVVEAHGTGTQVGDVVEMGSLNEVFGGGKRDGKASLYVTSIKGNIGHAEAAAGVAGLIKAVMMVREGVVPPQASFERLNGKMEEMGLGKLEVPTKTVKWSGGASKGRVVCVNSYGASGSNVAVVVGDAPRVNTSKDEDSEKNSTSKWPMLLSAASASSLQMYAAKLLEWVQSRHMSPIGSDSAQDRVQDILFNTTIRANPSFHHRIGIPITSLSSLETALSTISNQANTPTTPRRPLILVFAGQSSRIMNLPYPLYSSISLLRHHLDTVQTTVQTLTPDLSIYPSIFSPNPILDIPTLHICLFAAQYALTRCYLDSGLHREVQGVIGHSLGTFTALCIAGVLSLEDTLRLITGRARLLSELPPKRGGMMTLAATRQQIKTILDRRGVGADVEIACYNSPQSHVLSGDEKGLKAVEKVLAAEPAFTGVRWKRLDVAHAFHSAAMDPVLEGLRAIAEVLEWRKGNVEVELCVEDCDDRGQTFGAEMIVQHTRKPVFFSHAVRRLTEKYPRATWLEAGMGEGGAMPLVKMCLSPACSGPVVTPQKTSVFGKGESYGAILVAPRLVDGKEKDGKKWEDNLVNATVQLWNLGHSIMDWRFCRIPGDSGRHEWLSLPGYQFETTTHWIPYRGLDLAKLDLDSRLEPRKTLAECQTSTGSGNGLGGRSDSGTASHFQPTSSSQRETKPSKVQVHSDNDDMLLPSSSSGATCTFRINVQHPRWQLLLRGHSMCGRAVMPASLYIELVCRAALEVSRQSGTTSESSSWAPSVQDLNMTSPISLSDSSIHITLDPHQQNSTSRLDYNFTFTSSSSSATTTGLITLHPSTSSSIPNQLASLSRLAGGVGPRVARMRDNAEAQLLHGRDTVYRAFQGTVRYGSVFMGVTKIACVGTEGVAVVRSPIVGKGNGKMDWQAELMDSFMQPAGMLVNFFHPSAGGTGDDGVFVCHHIQYVAISPMLDASEEEWIVLANYCENGSNDMVADVYVFDQQEKMVFTARGLEFGRMGRERLGRMISGGLQQTSHDSEPLDLPSSMELPVVKAATPNHVIDPSQSLSKAEPSSRAELFAILSDIADIPVADLRGETNMADIGIDSLGATEMIGEVAAKMGVSMDLPTLLMFDDLDAMVAFVDGKSGRGAGPNREKKKKKPEPEGSVFPGKGANLEAAEITGNSYASNLQEVTTPPSVNTEDLELAFQAAAYNNAIATPASSSPSPYTIFSQIRLTFDTLAAPCGALNYWSTLYPDDARLLRAYIVSAFASLSCDLTKIPPGQVVPHPTPVLPRHERLVQRLFSFLAEQGVVTPSFSPTSSTSYLGAEPDTYSLDSNRWIRTSLPLDPTPGHVIHRELVPKTPPSHLALRHLLSAVSSQLAPILSGTIDALQILFGDRTNRKHLETLYAEWPMLKTAASLLSEFLRRIILSRPNTTVRILEVGAGTGGTTRHLLQVLSDLGTTVEYHFTDLSATLVSKARSTFQPQPFSGSNMTMSFSVLDIESPPPSSTEKQYDVIIATNVVHATRSLVSTLSNLRSMLRESGVLCMIEMMPFERRTPYVWDGIVGPLEGWWALDEKEREHALVGADVWERSLKQAGFGRVSSSGDENGSEEGRSVRVLCGFVDEERDEVMEMMVDGASDSGVSWTGEDSPTTDEAESEPGTRPIPTHPKTTPAFHVRELVYKTIDNLSILADIYIPTATPRKSKLPVALMIHGGSHILFSRRCIRPPQTSLLLQMGFLPVSIDHRLVPEVPLTSVMDDVCDAVEWARNELPQLLRAEEVEVDPERLVVVGWSSGGQLALSTAWTTREKRLKSPDAVLAFYCPTDYEDDWWKHPIQPVDAEDKGEKYDVLAGVQDEPITSYTAITSWTPLSSPTLHSDPRCRIVLHMNWAAQTLPVLINGLPSRRQLASFTDYSTDYNNLPLPTPSQLRTISPLAHVQAGKFNTPVCLVHGTEDDLIPHAQSERMVAAMQEGGVEGRLVTVRGAGHVCDGSARQDEWEAVSKAYGWLGRKVWGEEFVLGVG